MDVNNIAELIERKNVLLRRQGELLDQLGIIERTMQELDSQLLEIDLARGGAS